MKEKVLLGMSGGVDSTVSAILLQKMGYEVIGATMLLWKNESLEKIEEIKAICKKLKIQHHIFDFKDEFYCRVVKNFVSQYNEAKTPNPCVECNKYLKFGAFLDKAKELRM